MRAIVIGGNIAAGKSTIAPLVAEALNACFAPEPVELWRASGKLDEFYSGKLSAYEFQKYVLETRSSALQPRLLAWRASHGGENPSCIVFDRWLDDDRMFAEANHTLGKISDAEMAAYIQMHDETKKSFREHFASTTTIWLYTTPEECHARVQRRARLEEAAVSIGYLRTIETYAPKNIDLIVESKQKTPSEIVHEIFNYIKTQ